jgi:nicotinamidase/pyrazinamidase
VKALIIVDVQNDFLPGGVLAVPEGDQVIPVINDLSSEFDLVFTTQDWHTANHCSFAASYPDKKIGDRILRNKSFARCTACRTPTAQSWLPD